MTAAQSIKIVTGALISAGLYTRHVDVGALATEIVQALAATGKE